MDRPEWIACVKNGPNSTYCDRDPHYWCFVDINHALLSIAKNTRMQPCTQCMTAANPPNNHS